MKDKIYNNVQMIYNNVELNISVDDDLTGYSINRPLFRYGYLQISDGTIKDEPIYWDNLNFFIDCRKKEFKEECKTELKEKGYNWKEVYKDIKTLLERAENLKLL